MLSNIVLIYLTDWILAHLWERLALQKANFFSCDQNVANVEKPSKLSHYGQTKVPLSNTFGFDIPVTKVSPKDRPLLVFTGQICHVRGSLHCSFKLMAPKRLLQTK